MLIHQGLQCPDETVKSFLTSIEKIFKHYQKQQEYLHQSERDQDVTNLKYYEEKLQTLRQEGVQINANQIRKALRKVLRQTADVFSENETQSSQGSDKAPSEDNLAPDEIADVIPIEEDKDLFNKA